jgi:hypothetical protein
MIGVFSVFRLTSHVQLDILAEWQHGLITITLRSCDSMLAGYDRLMTSLLELFAVFACVKRRPAAVLPLSPLLPPMAASNSTFSRLCSTIEVRYLGIQEGIQEELGVFLQTYTVDKSQL